MPELIEEQIDALCQSINPILMQVRALADEVRRCRRVAGASDRTPIDVANDWTHGREFEALVTNQRCRDAAREAADILQYLQNCYSARNGSVIQSFDAYEIRQRLRYIESCLPQAEEDPDA